MKTTVIITLHYLTLVLLVTQEFWPQRYFGNVLKLGLATWLVISVLFWILTMSFSIRVYTQTGINNAIMLTKHDGQTERWYGKLWHWCLRLINFSVLGFCLVTGHWWSALIMSSMMISFKSSVSSARKYLVRATVNPANKSAVIEV